MKAMVMAAGLGTRLHPLTDYLPKPMVPIANRPVLHHLLNLLARHDIRQVGINVHYFPEMIKAYFGDGSALEMSIRWSQEEKLLGTAGGTKRLADFFGRETILVTSGDGLHDIDVTALLGHHQRTRALATLALKPVDDPSSYGVAIIDRDTRIRGFQEKPRRDEAQSDLANCGVYVIEPELLDRVPEDTFYDFGEHVWPSLVAAGEPVYAYTTMAYWNDVGGLDEGVQLREDGAAALRRLVGDQRAQRSHLERRRRLEVRGTRSWTRSSAGSGSTCRARRSCPACGPRRAARSTRPR